MHMTRRKKVSEKETESNICVSEFAYTRFDTIAVYVCMYICYARSKNALNQLILLLCVVVVVVVSNVRLSVSNDWYNDLRFDSIRSTSLPLSQCHTHTQDVNIEINMTGWYLQYGTKLNGNFKFFSGFHAHQWKWTQTLSLAHIHLHTYTYAYTFERDVYILRRSFIFLLKLL